MRIQTFTRSLAVSTGLALVLVAQPASAQLVSPGQLVSAEDSAGNPGQLSINNPDLTTANISVLAPVVVSNWNSFNVPQNTTLNISNDSVAAQASLLARVIGGNFSDIGGTINATDTNLWLINQNGILFSSDAAVNASSFFASTLDISDADFFDFYEGTNNAGNGTGTVRFQTNPAATTFILASGGRFKTDGTLMFVSPALNLAGDFNAGSGSAAFVAASDVSVTFNAGSPLGYGLNAGTSVASQLVSGSIAGNRADFVHFTQAAVTNALLTVDASVATTATASSTGISLRTASSGSNGVGVTVTGPLQSTGQIASSISGNASFSADMTGSLVALNVGGALSAKNIAATAGTTTLNAQNIDALAVSGRDGVSFQASNTGHANFASLNSANGSIFVSGYIPGAINVAGAVSGKDVELVALNAIQVGGEVTSTAGGVDLVSTQGSVNAQAISATGSDVQLRAGTQVSGGAISSTGRVEIDATGSVQLASIIANSDGIGAEGVTIGTTVMPSSITVTGATSGGSVRLVTGGAMQLGNVTSTAGAVDLDSTNGAISAGAVSATGGNAMLTAPGAITTSSLASSAAIDVDSNNGGNLNLGNLNAGMTVALDTTGGLTAGSVNAGGAFTVGATYRPSSLTLTGNASAASMALNTSGALSAQDLTATSGTMTLYGQAISASDLLASGNIRFSTANSGDATFDSLVSTGGVVAVDGTVPRMLTINGAARGTSVNLYGINGIQAGDVTATSGSASFYTFSGSVVAGNISATGGDATIASADSVNVGDIAATGGISANGAGGNMTLGDLSAGTGIALDTVGSLSFGSVNAPTAPLVIGASRVPTVVTNTGAINAGSLAARTSGALSLAGANTIGQINDVTAGGSLLINNASATTIAGTVTGASDVTLTSGGDLTIASTGGVTGGLVALSAFGNFINNSGSDAVTASDHWVIYSNAPAGNVFGGLDSGNTALWNATLATRAPGTISGNRYVFAYQPTLTVASTDASKVYGTDFTGMLDGYYTASGLQPGVAGAYQADTPASILSGMPTITSAGAVANADVAGSPYAISIAQGSLGVSNGYALVLTSSGKLTVTPKAITASVGANDKTYDGTTAATGTVTLNGTLAGDDIGTGGTTFTFSDKNVGTDKTVTVAGTTLTGADAGNYTLTVPASTLADIFARAINASVAANSKTYDGTTAATGTVTLNGVVAGDSVGTSGTVFAFGDKNVGTNKTVTITGTTLTGADAGNYTLAIPATTLADIFAKAISAAVAANSKTYDGTTAATGTVTLSGVVAGDNVGTTGTTFAFSDKNVGKDKTVTVSGTKLTGADAGNYTLTLPASTLADIFAKAITATVAANNKTYDGTTAASGTVTLNGVVAGDSVGTTGAVFTFSDKNAGTNKTVSVTGTTLTGADAGNYTVTFPTSTLASILQRALQITADDQVKFRNSADPALTYTVGGQGLVAGDTLTGTLTRQPGETLGDYAINQGTLSASANYSVSYAPGTLSIVRDPVADAAAAGQNALRALPLPSDTAATRGAILVVDADGLCAPEDKDCRVDK